MVIVFSGFAAGDLLIMKQMGVALVLAIAHRRHPRADAPRPGDDGRARPRKLVGAGPAAPAARAVRDHRVSAVRPVTTPRGPPPAHRPPPRRGPRRRHRARPPGLGRSRSARGTPSSFPRRSDHGVPGAAVLGDARRHRHALRRAPRAAVVPRQRRPAPQRPARAPAPRPAAPRPRRARRRLGLDVDAHRSPAGTRRGARRGPGPGDRDEATAFLAAHSPTTHGQPFARPGQLWLAVRDTDGRSSPAAAASRRRPAPPPWPASRSPPTAGGRPRAAVTAALTRRAVETAGACALGMFADNDAARRVYQRLGFTTGMRWRSRWLDAAPHPHPEPA